MTRPLLSTEALYAAANVLQDHAQAHHTSIALVGGLAMQVYGSDRLTADLDVIAEKRIAGLAAHGSLSFGGDQITVDNIPTDVIVRHDDYAPLYEAALERALLRSELRIRVVRPEYLLAIKLACGRPKDELDVAYLITSQVADRALARRIIKEHLGVYAAHDFDAVVDEVEWKQSRGKL